MLKLLKHRNICFCPDDASEYFKKGTDNTSACCNSNSDYVSGGRCYAKNKLQSAR